MNDTRTAFAASEPRPSPQPPVPYHPVSLLELLSRETLEHLLTGFREKLKTGVVIYTVKEDNPLKLVRIDPEQGGPDGREKYWARICREFRSTPEGDAACVRFDEKVVKAILSGVLSGPQTHFCEPLGLTDIAVPIVVREKTIGVVIAGQRITDESGQIEKICARVRADYFRWADSLEDALTRDLVGEDNAGFSPLSDTQQLEQCKNEVKAFASLIGCLCVPKSELGEKRKQDEILDYWIEGLSQKAPESTNEWAHHVQECLRSFFVFLEGAIEHVGLFHGEGKNDKSDTIEYALVAMNSPKWWKSQPFTVRRDRPLKVKSYAHGELPPSLATGVGSNLVNSNCFYVYPFCHSSNEKSPTERHGEVFSVAVVQCRKLLQEDLQEFCQRFLLDLCRRDVRMRLSIQQRELMTSFQQHVTQKRHDLKTSLQHVTSFAQKYARRLRGGILPDSAEGHGIYLRLQASIYDLSKQIEDISADPPVRRVAQFESVDFLDALKTQIDLFSLVAQEKRIVIKPRTTSCERAFVVCKHADLARAIAALLDNAIKYSYRDGRSVSVEWMVGQKEGTLTIENYGIGIPPDQLKCIMQPSERANIPDRVNREGSGMGLAIAAQVFQDILGGSIKIESCRPKSVTGITDDYHRYVTTVSVTVPIQREDG